MFLLFAFSFFLFFLLCRYVMFMVPWFLCHTWLASPLPSELLCIGARQRVPDDDFCVFSSLLCVIVQARTTNWGCAFDVKRPWNMHQDMLEYEALVSQVNWQHPSSNTKLAKHSLNMLSTELEHMFLQLTCIRCVEDDSTPAVVAQLAQVVQERERRLAFLIGEIQRTGEFRPELLQLLQHTHEKMIPAVSVPCQPSSPASLLFCFFWGGGGYFMMHIPSHRQASLILCRFDARHQREGMTTSLVCYQTQSIICPSQRRFAAMTLPLLVVSLALPCSGCNI